MALFKKSTSQRQTQENESHKALKAWHLTRGIQRDLRNKENGARIGKEYLHLPLRGVPGRPLSIRTVWEFSDRLVGPLAG